MPNFATDSAEPRRASFMGRQFRIVSAVLVRSQVLNNNLGRTYLPAAEFTDTWAEQWNGIPVLIGPHPSLDGQPATGRHPDVWNERAAGWVFSARIENEANGGKRLVAEVWLDEGRAEHIEGLPAVLLALDEGKRIELSTGFATVQDETPGVHNGTSYDLVMHPQGADHLVVSTAMTGACSVSDGCGLGTNCACGGACQTKPKEEVFVAQEGAEPVGPRWIKRTLERVATLFQPRAEVALNEAYEQNVAANVQRQLEALQEMAPSDQERRVMVQEALQSKFGTAERQVSVCDTFSDQKQVVFWYTGSTGPMPKGSEYYRSTWTGEPGSAMQFSEPELVRKMTTYEPVPAAASSYNEEGSAAQQAQNTQEEVMEKDVENKLLEAVNALTAKVDGLTAKVDAIETREDSPAIAGLKRSVSELASQFKTMAGVTEQAVTERERERQSLVTELAGNFRVPFTEAELEGKPIDELRKLKEMAASEDYAGRGGPHGRVNNEQRFMEPVPYHKRDKKEGE